MASYTQRSFAGGEIAPSLFARTDQAKYANSARRLLNMVVMRHGGAQNRAGTRFVAETKHSDSAQILIDFEFSSSDSCIIEVGDLYCRFHKYGFPVLNALSFDVSGITNASQAMVTTYSAHGIPNGTEITFNNTVSGMTELNGRPFLVSDATTYTFKLKTKGGIYVNSTSFAPFTVSPPAYVFTVYEIASPYAAGDLRELQWKQLNDTLFFAHKNYAPRKLVRTSDTSWAFTALTFAASIAPPTSVTSASSLTGSGYTTYVVTSLSANGEESVASAASGNYSGTPTAASPLTLTWTGAAGAVEYNVYKSSGPIATPSDFGFVGVSTSTTFGDSGVPPDYSERPPGIKNPFSGAGNYPSAVGLFTQRLFFGRTNNNPQGVWGSVVGSLNNFNTHSPLQDDDAITFTMLGAQEVRHLVDLGKFVIPSRAGTWVCQTEAITPTSINAIRDSDFGVSTIKPVTISGSIVYVQNQSPAVIRDLGFQFESQGYRGNDLTVFAPHMFELFPPLELAYQKTPNQILWAPRADGMLIGMTYVREQQIVAWHRHMFSQLMQSALSAPSAPVYPAGLVENACVVAEGGDTGQDFLYLVIKRYDQIEGRDVKYIERMATRYLGTAEKRPLDPTYYTAATYQNYPIFPDGVKDSIYVDSAVSYDGRNLNPSATVTLSGGTDWDSSEQITMTVSGALSGASEVGNEIHILTQLNGADGRREYLRLTIEAFGGGNYKVRPINGTVPVLLRNVATVQWARAVNVVSGGWHLEGSLVAVMGDGMIVANPFRDDLESVSVENGSVQLGACYAVIHVGLPYVQEVETLDIDTPEGPGLGGHKKKVCGVKVFVEETRGFSVGSRYDKKVTGELNQLVGSPWNIYENELEPAVIRSNEPYESTNALKTGWVEVPFKPEWNSNGRVLIRNVDGLPFTVLAVKPEFDVG